MRRLLAHPGFGLAARILLGLVFIAAALPKLADPPGFAKAIWAYDLAPPWSLHPLALVLPWLELLCGLALLLGLWLRPAALWTSGLLLAFCLALAINLVRQHPIDCGCFGATAVRSVAERLADLRWALLRDVGLLLLAAQVSWTSFRKAAP
jgi:putative oxidoreductase